jgi:antitoxin MazE
METSIIKIGTSKGVILPFKLLKTMNLSEKSLVEISAENGKIVIAPCPRQGWAAAAKQLHDSDSDELLIPDVFNDEEILDYDGNTAI